MKIKKIAAIVLSFSLFSCASVNYDTYKIFDSESGTSTNTSYKDVQVTANMKKPISNSFINSCTRYPDQVDPRAKLIDVDAFHKDIQSAEVINSWDEANYKWTDGKRRFKSLVATESISSSYEKFIIGNLKIHNEDQGWCWIGLVKNICEAQTGDTCTTRQAMDSLTAYNNAEKQREHDERMKRIMVKTEASKQIHAENRKNAEAEFLRLRNKCKSYGFTGEQNIRVCIQKEAQYELEELKIAQENTKSKIQGGLGFFGQILRDVIVSYPEMKAQADKEEAIRRKAFRDGQRAEQARCSGGRC